MFVDEKILEDIKIRYFSCVNSPEPNLDIDGLIPFIKDSMPYLKEAYNALNRGPRYPDKTILPLPEYAEFYIRGKDFSGSGTDYRIKFAMQELLSDAAKNLYHTGICLLQYGKSGISRCPVGLDYILESAEKAIFLKDYAKTYSRSNMSTERFFEKYTPKIKDDIGFEKHLIGHLKSFAESVADKIVIYDVSEKILPDKSVEQTFHMKFDI